MTTPHKDHVAIRLDADTQARLDALTARLSPPSHQATSSEVLRKVILAGLDVLEKDPTYLDKPSGKSGAKA